MTNAVVRYLIERLKEFSTWRGLAALGATLGVLIAPAQLDAAYKAFIALLGLAAVLSADKKAN